ncbi:MAG: hypothetical protein ACI4PO_11810 [Faecousia sp.]
MDWKTFLRKLLFPPVWLILLLSAASAAALIWVFTAGLEEALPAYPIYVLAFYSLSVLCVFCCVKLPKRIRGIRQRIDENPLGHRYLTSRTFRSQITLYLSLGINLLYVLTNLWSWHLSRSMWFVVLAVYYVIMALMRGLLAGFLRKHKPGERIAGEWKRARVCACVLLLVNLSLSAAVLMILYRSKGYQYPGMMIYVMALYTFYAVIHAAVELVRYRSLGSPILSTAKAVSLSAALVSLLNLETAMFAQFGADMPPEDQRLMIILTGAGVSLAIVTMSAGLIVRSHQNLRSISHGKQ